MKKLLKCISPLAPDDSGACSVLYEMGGITVICDAGGCAGNVCGFDEPRWSMKRSALFSAGLRDMDAVFGPDKYLIKKLTRVTEQVDARFTAIVGTPVPAVIATDLKALERLSEEKTGLPCLTFRTDGTGLYDKGEEMAYLRLFERFAADRYETQEGLVGVIGATPLNAGVTRSEPIRKALTEMGWRDVVCFGLDSGLEEVERASRCQEILVMTPSGLKAAELLEERFGIPFKTGYPLPLDGIVKEVGEAPGRTLIIHQQMAANALREELGGDAVCAGMFMMDERYMRPGDLSLREEDELRDIALSGDYDTIIADRTLWKAMKGSPARLIDFPHFAVGGRLG